MIGGNQPNNNNNNNINAGRDNDAEDPVNVIEDLKNAITGFWRLQGVYWNIDAGAELGEFPLTERYRNRLINAAYDLGLRRMPDETKPISNDVYAVIQHGVMRDYYEYLLRERRPNHAGGRYKYKTRRANKKSRKNRKH
jgi:hypothetical protein